MYCILYMYRSCISNTERYGPWRASETRAPARFARRIGSPLTLEHCKIRGRRMAGSQSERARLDCSQKEYMSILKRGNSEKGGFEQRLSCKILFPPILTLNLWSKLVGATFCTSTFVQNPPSQISLLHNTNTPFFLLGSKRIELHTFACFCWGELRPAPRPPLQSLLGGLRLRPPRPPFMLVAAAAPRPPDQAGMECCCCNDARCKAPDDKQLS